MIDFMVLKFRHCLMTSAPQRSNSNRKYLPYKNKTPEMLSYEAFRVFDVDSPGTVNLVGYACFDNVQCGTGLKPLNLLSIVTVVHQNGIR